jgi:hypothetical protein
MRRTSLGLAMALALAVVPGGAALAAETMEDGVPHPSHIHEGLCPAPGGVVAPLSDVAAPMGDASGPGTAVAVEIGESSVDLALADILAGEHAIVVHRSADEMATYLVCGDIGGTVVDGILLAIGLGAVGDSGHAGVALLADNGDGTTSVSVFLTGKGDAMMGGDGY